MAEKTLTIARLAGLYRTPEPRVTERREQQELSAWDKLQNLFTKPTKPTEWDLASWDLANIAVAAWDALADHEHMQFVDFPDRALICLTRDWLGDACQTKWAAQELLARINSCIRDGLASNRQVSVILLKIRNALTYALDERESRKRLPTLSTGTA